MSKQQSSAPLKIIPSPRLTGPFKHWLFLLSSLPNTQWCVEGEEAQRRRFKKRLRVRQHNKQFEMIRENCSKVFCGAVTDILLFFVCWCSTAETIVCDGGATEQHFCFCLKTRCVSVNCWKVAMFFFLHVGQSKAICFLLLTIFMLS